jgi:hypothetical protein
MGADICTIPFSVMQQLAKHPLTDIGLEKFLADWKKHVEAKTSLVLNRQQKQKGRELFAALFVISSCRYMPSQGRKGFYSFSVSAK